MVALDGWEYKVCDMDTRGHDCVPSHIISHVFLFFTTMTMSIA